MRYIVLSIVLLCLFPCVAKPKPRWISGIVGYYAVKGIAFGVVTAAANFTINKMAQRGHARLGGHCIYRGITYVDGIPTGIAADVTRDVIKSYELQPQACECTAAVIASAGGGAGAVSVIETTALWVQAALTAIPWIP